MTLFKTLLFSLLVPGSVTVLIPYLLLDFSADYRASVFHSAAIPGWILITFGLLIYGWCAWDFTFTGKGTPSPTHPPQQLVVKGLYRYTRNPMYVGIAVILSGEAWLFRSLNLLIYAVIVALAFHLRVVYYEEPVLRKSFGVDFEKYCQAVSRWWPTASRQKL